MIYLVYIRILTRRCANVQKGKEYLSRPFLYHDILYVFRVEFHIRYIRIYLSWKYIEFSMKTVQNAQGRWQYQLALLIVVIPT